MNHVKLLMVRVYLTEKDKLLRSILDFLHYTVHVAGVTVYRAISGYGESGVMHSTEIMSLSLNLPIVVEFFDDVDKLTPILLHLSEMVGEGHVVSWLVDKH